MNEVQNWFFKGSRLNYSGCRTPSEVNEDNLNNVRQEATRHCQEQEKGLFERQN
jgi:hypothetical protein